MRLTSARYAAMRDVVPSVRGVMKPSPRMLVKPAWSVPGKLMFYVCVALLIFAVLGRGVPHFRGQPVALPEIRQR